MKCFLSVLVFSILFVQASAQKTWTGSGGNKLWSNGANWSPAGTPGSLDNVLVNISDSINIDVAPNINSVTITGSAAVIFSTTNSRSITISSTSTTQLGLLINAGSSLTVQGVIPGTTTVSLTLALTGGIGVTGEIYGSLYFKSVGAGSGSSNTRLDTYAGPVAYAQLKVKNGGLIKYDDKSGNTASAGSPINSITMEGGSTYWINKNGGSFPDGSWAPTSLCKTTGTVANGASFNGAIYGNLEWNCPSQTAVYGFNKDISFNDITLTAAGGNALRVKSGGAASSFTLTVNGNLSIASGVTLETSGSTVSAPNGGVVEIKGNLVNNGLITETGPAGTKDTISFSGTSPQTISGTGTVTNQQTFKIDNAAGVTLTQALSLPYLLYLKNGLLNTSTINILILQSGCSVRTASSSWYTNLNAAGYTNYGGESSYIAGPVRKLGLSAASRFGFPVGSATQFRPVFLDNVTGDYLVEYTQSNPRAALGTTYGPGLDHISAIEYWLITRTSGSGTADVELSFYDPNSGGVTNMTDLLVAQYSGGTWLNAGNAATVGTAGANGSVTSATVSTNFSYFTLGSSTTQNPLPLRTLDISANKTSRNTHIQWTVNADQDVQAYRLEKSFDGRNFSSVHQTTAARSAVSKTYNYADAAVTSRVYYRVQAMLYNGRNIYSTIIMLPGDGEAVTVYPNPATSQLNISLSKPGGQLVITNAAGRMVYRTAVNDQTFSINLQQWAKGVYQLMYLQPGNEKQVKTFIVN